MSDVKFQVGDRVRWGTAEGVVESVSVHASILVEFNGRRILFGPDGSVFVDIPGQPLLELIERPKKTRKVKVWRWEKLIKYDNGWHLEQSPSLFGENGWHDKNGWTKVPGSEREIEVSTDE